LKLSIIVFFVASLFAATSEVFAATLTWNRNAESDMDHYNLYTCPTVGCTVVKGVNKSSVVVLQPAVGVSPTISYSLGLTSSVAVTAVDKTGNESGLSNQASLPTGTDTLAPASPTNLTVK